MTVRGAGYTGGVALRYALEAIRCRGSQGSTTPTTCRHKPPAFGRSCAALAEQGIYFGTSSWKYEGWLGSIYSQDRYVTRGKLSKKKFEETCLAEYAQTFPTVCGDFAFYQFPTEEYWERLFGQIPAGFLLGLKVPEDITVPIWPKHARYGKRAGLENEHFLDARTFERFFAKAARALQGTARSADLRVRDIQQDHVPDSRRFPGAARSVPRGPCRAGSGTRSRSATQTTCAPDYFGLLGVHNVAHVFNAWTRMPVLDRAGPALRRLHGGLHGRPGALGPGAYLREGGQVLRAVRAIQEPNEGARRGWSRSPGSRCSGRSRPALFVNNRLEGNAPTTIEEVAKNLV